MVTWIIHQPISPPLHVYKLRLRPFQANTQHRTIHLTLQFTSSTAASSLSVPSTLQSDSATGATFLLVQQQIKISRFQHPTSQPEVSNYGWTSVETLLNVDPASSVTSFSCLFSAFSSHPSPLSQSLAWTKLLLINVRLLTRRRGGMQKHYKTCYQMVGVDQNEPNKIYRDSALCRRKSSTEIVL